MGSWKSTAGAGSGRRSPAREPNPDLRMEVCALGQEPGSAGAWAFGSRRWLVKTGALDSGGRHLCKLLENRLVKLREVPTLFAEHA